MMYTLNDKFVFARIENDEEVIKFTISSESTMDEMCEHFERFLKSVGYCFDEGQHIGYEYDEEKSVESKTFDNAFSAHEKRMNMNDYSVSYPVDMTYSIKTSYE